MVRGEAKLLQRLLRATSGCYDDLVVVHDGAEEEKGYPSVSQVVAESGGRFFARDREFQQEPHWPFAWNEARHDWILRLDADELPSDELRNWLLDFRDREEPTSLISGYTCIWPLWDGRKIVTRRWPNGRIFIINKQRVRFFGMVEQVPLADGMFEPVPLVLEHRPPRKSFGFSNLLLRRQAYRWRHTIAHSLLGTPAELSVSRWDRKEWPPIWEQIRHRPLRTGLYRLFVWPLRTLRDMWRTEGCIIWGAIIFNGLHHFLIACEYLRLRRRSRG